MTAKVSTDGDGAIAIIGMACRFPGAPDLETFWKNLCDGVEGVRRFDQAALRDLGVAESDLHHRSFVPAGGVLDDVDRFDAEFFQIIPRHAELLDPQQRLLLECAWEALEHAGHHPQHLPGAAGVYLSVAKSTYPQGLLQSAIESVVALAGADKDYAASRIAYKLNLRGPSVMVQTASSSSLVAVHLACESLRNGECDVALAGGACIGFPQAGYVYDEALMFSRDGRCRPFDADASGTVPGNGVGVVVLKPLADALADGDFIWAVIKGSAVNNDGDRKVDFYAPSVEGQRTVVQEALALANVPAETIGYVETHGTGTVLGDPIEIEALTQAFGSGLPPGCCALGSVKSNIGHLHSAAGIASLIKAALMVQHGTLVPSLHFQQGNSRIPFGQIPFRVVTAQEAWPSSSSPRRAGVSSFGFGGTNAHLILEEPPPRSPSKSSAEWKLLPVSARTATALKQSCLRLANHLQTHPHQDLSDVAWTLQIGRKPFAYRRVVLCRTLDEAISLLLQEDDSIQYPVPLDPSDQELISLRSFAQAWIDGAEHKWRGSHLTPGRQRVWLPTYPFERQSYWAESPQKPSARLDFRQPVADVGQLDQHPHNNRLVPDSTVNYEDLLWSTLMDVLGRASVPVEFDRTFAELGVDSIIGPQWIAQLNQRWGTELSPTELFHRPTVRQLASHLSTLNLAKPAVDVPTVANLSAQPGKFAIAVIGMAGRFPGARNLQEYWASLAAGKDSVRPIPRGAWGDVSTQGHFGALLEDFDCFDSLFFQISPQEAEQIDPQQRLFLETAWHALEDAGYSENQLQGRRVGVFVGAQPNDYASSKSGAHATIGSSLAVLAARIAYHLDLHGPSLSVDTACSSSLVAMHLACQSLWNGDSEMALAGGVSCQLFSPRSHQFFQDAGMASPTGCCRTFDAQADGFVPGEGVGAVVLKSLDAALRDRDVIHGVIRGIGTNQDGKSNGLTAPSLPAQVELECAVYDEFQIDPATISYVESHGTGTRLGDPIEIQALTNAFRRFTDRRQFCGIGSVKTNIGHSLTAAGIAGVIKVLLSLKHRTIPPSLHFERANEFIPLATSPFYVTTELKDWVADAEGLRRAAVSSFGFSGTNAHLVIEESPAGSGRKGVSSDAPSLLTVSAKTVEALRQRLCDLRDWFHSDDGQRADLGDVAYTLATGRTHFEVRTVLAGRDKQDGIAQIERALAATDLRVELPADLAPEWRAAAAQYLLGQAVAWERFFSDRFHARVSLPGYPFARIRHWHRTADRAGTTSRFGLNANSWTEQVHKLYWTGDEWFWQDHVVRGQRMLPAVVMLELVRASLRSQGLEAIDTICDVSWVRPLIAAGGSIHAELTLRKFGPEGEWELTEGSEPSKKLVARGRWKHGEVSSRAAMENLSLDSLRQRCSRLEAGSQLYQRLRMLGFEYGPRFQTVQRLWIGTDELLAELALPEGIRHDDQEGAASLLEGALHSLWGFFPKAAADELPLPCGLGEITWRSPLTSPCFLHAVAVNRRDEETSEYELTLLDVAGNILLTLRDYAVRHSQKALRTSESVSELALAETCCYEPVWRDAPLAGSQSTTPDGCTLLLASDELSRSVAKALLDQSRAEAPMIVAEFSDGYRHLGQNSYTLNAHARGDYETLLADLHRRGLIPQRVVFLGCQDDSISITQVEAIEREWLSCLTCAQAFMPASAPAVALWYVGRWATWWGGAARTLTQENPRLRVRLLDLVEQDAARMADRLLREWHAAADAIEIRYRDGQRQVRQLRTLQPELPHVDLWRVGGRYLIAGGAGGVGLTLARNLVETYQARVILTGRSALTPALREQLRQLGDDETVSYLQADISQAEDVRRLFAEVRRCYGHLQGIIQAAGVTRDAYLVRKDLHDLSAVLAPKLAGTIWLDEFSQDQPLDVFIMCSSIAAIFGNPGQVDYAAANGFLDAFASWREAQRQRGLRSGRTLALNWPPWREVGLQTAPAVVQQWRDQIGLELFPAAAAWDVLNQALCTGRPQVVLLHGERERLDRFALDDRRLQSEEAQPAETLPASLETMQQLLRTILSAELKIPAEHIKWREPLERYGIDSVMVHQLNRALERRFGPLPKTLLLEHNTLGEVAGYLARNHAPALGFVPSPPPRGRGLGRGGERFTALSSVVEQPPQKLERRVDRVYWSGQSGVDRPPLPNPLPRGGGEGTGRGLSSDIAIIGISGRFPQARDLDEFWENLRTGVDCIREIPAERWDMENFFQPGAPALGKSYTKWGGFLDDVDQFDPLLFQIAPRDAALIDPQERLFLEETWTALENAGYTRQSLARSGPVGVFVGVMYGDYGLLANEEGAKGHYVPATSAYWSIANRVSFVFNLQGPSLAIDTACSSSLTAIHLACESLRRGECQVALAGGVNLSLHPSKYLGLSHGRFASVDGRCRSFGAQGTGYVPGEGVGVVVLKPLADAEADGDCIHGVIKSTVINHGGKTSRYTAPNPRAQAELIRRALQQADVPTESITCVEAHGTGTELGDPLEIHGLIEAFGGPPATRPACSLGSVKSNIGHLEAASGMAAVAKVLLQMRHGQLAPSLHCDEINPAIDLSQSPFVLQRQLTDWPRPTLVQNGRPTLAPRRAGISSFGAGGANAHLILEEYDAPPREAPAVSNPLLFVLSARSEAQLRQSAARLREFLNTQHESGTRLADLAFTLQVGREPMRWRLAIVVKDFSELVQRLEQFLTGQRSQGLYSNEVREDVPEPSPAWADTFRSLVQQGQWHELAQRWVEGCEIDWLALGIHAGRCRVPLPTYPFDRQRYWIAQSREPVAGERAWTATPGQPGLSLVWKSSDPLFCEHRVAGKSLYPAAGLLALVQSAVEHCGLSSRLAGFRDVLWPRPLIADADRGTVRVIWNEFTADADFEIVTDDQDRRPFCSGKFLLGDARVPHVAPPLDLPAIRQRCPKRMGQAEIYEAFRRRGVDYGRLFQRQMELWIGTNEALARLEPFTAGESNPETLSPTLLDAAWQAALGLFPDLPTGGLPFAVERLELFGPLQGPCYAYVQSAQPTQSKLLHCDVTIVAESGQILARLTKFSIRVMSDSPRIAPETSAVIASTPPDRDPILYLRPEWTPCQLPVRSIQTAAGSVLIVFDEFGRPLADDLSRRLPGPVLQASYGSNSERLAAEQFAAERWIINPRRQADFERLLSEAGPVRELIFLGGLHDPAVAVGDAQALHDAEDLGVLSLLRLIRAWSERVSGRNLNLRIVTNGVFSIRDADRPQPWKSAVLGLAQVAGRELPLLQTVSLDLPANCHEPAVMTALTDWLQIEVSDRLLRNNLAYREGRWYRRQLAGVELPATDSLPLRTHGVYLIVGGAGGLGMAVARELARTVQARLVLIGRRSESELRAQIQELEALGGSVLYVQGDITQADDLRAAVAAARRRWGQVNGVIHSALVLEDRSLPRMDEAAFRRALDPKAVGSIHLAQAVAGEPLDFLAFFSSANALEGNPGQANYVAGCVFKDAFAHYLRVQHGLPVKIINWGYWGELGVTATPEIRQRLARQGIGSISEAEGLNAFRRALASPLPQVSPIKADSSLLTRLGIDANRRSVLSPVGPSVIQALRERAEQADQPSPEMLRSLRAFDKVDDLARRWVAAQLLDLGLTPEWKLTIGEWVRRLGIAPRYEALLAALFAMLEADQVLQCDGDHWQLAAGFRPISHSELMAEREQLQATEPITKPYLLLLDACLSRYPALLRGQVEHMEVLFPQGSLRLVEAIYTGNPAIDYYNQLLADFARTAVQKLAEQHGGKIRLLEVGAGTGGAARWVLAALREFAERIEYVYTDLSNGFLRHAEQQFGRDYPFLTTRLFNVEQDPREQGLEPGRFDVVLAYNVIHATHRLDRSLSHCKRLLKTNGVLLLNELSRRSDFATITFGLTPGWWRYEDSEDRLPHGPASSVHQWRRLLEEAGFRSIGAHPSSEFSSTASLQTLFLAESDGWVDEVTSASLSESPGTPLPAPSMEQHTPLASSAALPNVPTADAARQRLEHHLLHVFSEVLKLPAGSMRPEEPFDHYGLESLAILEITAKLESDLGELPKTLLFEQHSVSRLTADLLEHHRPAVEQWFIKSSPSATPKEPSSPTAPAANGVSSRRSRRPEEESFPIAIVGMSGRYPDAENLDEFWDNLRSGHNCIREIPADRWDYRRYFDATGRDELKSHTRYGGFLKDIDCFDAGLFHLSPKEARAMDPQERLMLETAWSTLEDAAYTAQSLKARCRRRGGDVGVFSGIMSGAYQWLAVEEWARGRPTVPHSAYWSVSNRMSFVFDFQGPSLAVDTACSSSLAAIHLACESLRRGECRAALAGGVHLLVHPLHHIGLSQMHMLTSDTACRAFGADADGFTSGEGVGLVLLRPLADAIEDGDRIYGVIKGSMLNAGGRTSGYTVPNPRSQSEVVSATWRRAGIHPRTLTCLEAHGTGTALGDPIEVRGLQQAFSPFTSDRQFCALGSVKSGIGHLEAAAGIASVTKVVLQLQHQLLVPTLHAERVNPLLELDESPFFLQRDCTPWRRPTLRLHGAEREYPRRAGVSSFGAGGANVHLVLEEHDAGEPGLFEDH